MNIPLFSGVNYHTEKKTCPTPNNSKAIKKEKFLQLSTGSRKTELHFTVVYQIIFR